MPEIAIGLPLIPTQSAKVSRRDSKSSEDTYALPEAGKFAGLLEQMKGKGEVKSKLKSSTDTGEGSEEKKETDHKNEYISCICPPISDAVVPKIRLLNDGNGLTGDKSCMTSQAVIQQTSSAPGVIVQESPDVKGTAENSVDLQDGELSSLASAGLGDTETIAVHKAEEEPFENDRLSGIGNQNAESVYSDKAQNITDTAETVYSGSGRAYGRAAYTDKATVSAAAAKPVSDASMAEVNNELKAKIQPAAAQSETENRKAIKPQENVKKLFDTSKDKEGNDILMEHNLSVAPQKTSAAYQQEDIRQEGSVERPEMQLAHAINENLSKGTERFTVKLKPEGLGEVTVRLALNGDTLAVSIRSSEHSTNDLIGSRLDELRSSLEDGGCKVGLLNLETQAQGGESSREGHASSQRVSPQYEEADVRGARSEGKSPSETAARVIGYKSGIINYRI